MIQAWLAKIGFSFAGKALKENAGPIILFVIITGVFAFAGWKYHSLYVMAMETKVELTEVRGELNNALNEKAQYLSTIDQQNKGLEDLKRRTNELQGMVTDAKERASTLRNKYQQQRTLVEDVTLTDTSCEGVMQWMAEDAKEAAKW